MEPTGEHAPVITRQQLDAAMADGRQHPEETQWMIYRYLKTQYATLGSVEARRLLAAYIRLHVQRPSLVNSCMLGLALKIAAVYPDFRLPQFLKALGYDTCLREEDCQSQTGKDGRRYLSLRERVERARASYLLHHPGEDGDGCDAIAHMLAVKVFEKERQGRKHRFVKLVAPDGLSMVADSHQFPCKPWEIAGRLFDVLTRASKQGNERAAEIVVSAKKVSDVFSVETGYVDGIDMQHGHVHVFDVHSRHFVADRAALQVKGVAKGSFVRFCPVIAHDDPFKCAAIIGVLPKETGREAFGVYEATVLFVNRMEHYWKYALVSGPRAVTVAPCAADTHAQPVSSSPSASADSSSTVSSSAACFASSSSPASSASLSISSPSTLQDDAVVAHEGFAQLALLPEARRATLAPGDRLHLVLFLRRGKDGTKRNHVAEVF